MKIRFVLDENVRGPLWRAILRHNASGGLPIDATRVGEPPDLPLGCSDEILLEWCEREGRILVSLDQETLPVHLADRLAVGKNSPGIFLIRPNASLRGVLDALVLVAHAGDPVDSRDQVVSIP
ncbi:hypothetical protein [Tautonia plasticadhaerens]|uniref:DUF5615 domain-containing protein n=1 Tax=Tautonia plasticadhaerens TaxID=2527974 RepID=A0A518H2G9_9BACT|nr:hypothetical protein [Tautonia plasticadhaerens]QDV35038.1 hypothetical protein ElP_29370 [Tautonia plasticadhaerens]